jgi:hypothetical protein
MSNTQAGEPPLVACPRLLIQYIRSCPPKLEGVSSIRNLRTRHAVVTRDPPNMGSTVTVFKNISIDSSYVLIQRETILNKKSKILKIIYILYI